VTSLIAGVDSSSPLVTSGDLISDGKSDEMQPFFPVCVSGVCGNGWPLVGEAEFWPTNSALGSLKVSLIDLLVTPLETEHCCGSAMDNLEQCDLSLHT
jgi:hypothetical protein